MSPSATTRWLVWGLQGPVEQAQAGRREEFGLGTRHQSCSQWVCLPGQNGKTDVGVIIGCLKKFFLDKKIWNSPAWDLPLEISWKYYGSSTGDGEAIIVHSGQNQREKGGREMPGSLELALDRRKPSHVYEWAALSTESLWGHIFVGGLSSNPTPLSLLSTWMGIAQKKGYLTAQHRGHTCGWSTLYSICQRNSLQ